MEEHLPYELNCGFYRILSEFGIMEAYGNKEEI